MASLDDLLLRTSRTFALSIPRLPMPLRQEVTVAYLLFRIADTFEDAADWAKERRLQALADFARLLQACTAPLSPELLKDADRLASSWTADDPPSNHEGYLDLLSCCQLVLKAHADLTQPARDVITRHALRTAQGMASIISRHDNRGRLHLSNLADLRHYCYLVAGIVGELLTELFLLAEIRLTDVAAALKDRAAQFGEALQLVNILKDSLQDAQAGRTYLPTALGRAPILALARQDIQVATEYVQLLYEGGGSQGLLAFTSLPIALAARNLERLEKEGPGAKLTRVEVTEIVTAVERRIAAKLPPLCH